MQSIYITEFIFRALFLETTVASRFWIYLSAGAYKSTWFIDDTHQIAEWRLFFIF